MRLVEPCGDCGCSMNLKRSVFVSLCPSPSHLRQGLSLPDSSQKSFLWSRSGDNDSEVKVRVPSLITWFSLSEMVGKQPTGCLLSSMCMPWHMHTLYPPNKHQTNKKVMPSLVQLKVCVLPLTFFLFYYNNYKVQCCLISPLPF